MSWNCLGGSRLAPCVALAVFIASPLRASAQVSFADSAELLVIEGQRAADQHTPESLERAIQLFQRAHAQLDGPEHRGRAGTVLNDIGSSHQGLGNTDSALVYFTRALNIRREIDDVQGQGTTLYNLGTVLYSRGRVDTALVYYREALDVYQRLGYRAGEAEVLGAIGLAYQKLSRADSAFAYLSRALPLARGLPDRRVEARMLEFFGSVHCALGRTDSARIYLADAHDIQRRLDDLRGEVGTTVSEGCLPSREPLDATLVRLHETLRAARAVSDRLREAIVLDQIGTAHRTLSHADSALAYYAQALDLERRIGDQGRVGVILIHVAVLHADEGRPDSALAYYAQALPFLRDANDWREEGTALVNIGVLHHHARTPASMTRAVAYYDSADAVLAQVAHSAGGDDAWLSFAELHASLFGSWALGWLEREKQVGARRAAYAALAAAERGRAQALRDLMRRRAGAEQGQAVGPAHTGPGANLPDEGRALVSQFQRSGIPAVSYMVTDSTLITFLVRGREVEVFTTLVSAVALSALVSDLRKGLRSDDSARAARGIPGGNGAPDASGPRDPGDSDAWRAPAARLADLLLPPRLREHLPASGELVIVPSGPLFLLPFAVLPVSGGSDADSFLGLRYAIRYAPSLQVLASLGGEMREAWPTEQALVVGNPTMPWVGDSITGLYPSPLPHAETEADSVAERLGTKRLLGPNATEGAVRERMASATLIHLATHGRAYETADSARESYVVLARGSDDDSLDNNGLLTVGEVLDEVSPLRAELVVLSACETGLGNLTQSEGTVGMQRAFLARGARGVLVSLWSVGDSSTSVLMQRFYEHWLEDTPQGQRPRAEALRLAQRALFEDGFVHPLYWAAFQLVGAR